MAEYIKREDAYTTLTDYYHHSTEIQHMALKEALDRVPAADVVERKTGKWIDGKCDQCGAHAPFWSMASTYYESKFCPHCGCKMI